RPFNVFGPRQRDLGYGGVISIFTRRILTDHPPIIYGDGGQTRDYTYVEDVVRAYDAVLNHKDPLPEPINFASGKEISILDLANLIIELCDKKIRPVHVGSRVGDVKKQIGDSGRYKK